MITELRMKRFFLLLAVFACAVSVQAIQRPPLAVGFTYNYATEYKQHGLGVKLQAPLGRHLRIEPEIIYFNENHDVTTLHLNVNVHYLLPMSSRLNIYPFAGVGYSHWGYVGPNANRWGVNLGGGIDYDLGRRWGFMGELRVNAVSRETQIIPTLGVKYQF